MTVAQRARLQAFISKGWVLKLLCIAIAIPIVWSAFAPVLLAAHAMHG